MPILCWFLSLPVTGFVSYFCLYRHLFLAITHPLPLSHIASSLPPPHSVLSVPSFSSLFPCPVSSDLYKSLQSGSQVALPPHLQLAFSGKICPSLHPQSLLHWLPPLAFSLSKCLARFCCGFVLNYPVLFCSLLICWWLHALCIVKNLWWWM